MSKSYSKIRHMQKSNLLLESRLLTEQEVKMVQGSTWACYDGAEGPPPDYERIEGNQIEFFQDDSMDKSLGKVFLPKAQRTRGQFCGVPSQVGTSVVLTSDQGKYTCTTDCLPS
jgi:hypothetical protein